MATQPRPAKPAASTHRVGCVSFLNTAPLVDGLVDDPRLALCPDVPARLLDGLERDDVDVALCPVIDYHRSGTPVVVVPVGGIACEGPTLTVRLFSRVPIEQVDTVHADTDSHTSVALLQVLLHGMHGRRLRIVDYDARHATPDDAEAPLAMLLIGDKVVTDSPRAVLYPHQLDLGEAWKALTGLPFVFAVWMARAGRDLGDLPTRLEEARDHNAVRIDAIAAEHGPAHGWPTDLARQYLGRILRYTIGPRELQAIERFAAMAAALDLVPTQRPLVLYPEERHSERAGSPRHGEEQP